MTRRQMADQVRYWIGLQDIASYDESALVYDQLYYGTIDLLARTKCTVRPFNLEVSAGVDEYILPHSLLGLVDLEDGQRWKARRDQSLTVPEYMLVDQDPPNTFTLIGSDLLRVAPVPSADGVIEVMAVKKPAQMVLDTDSPGDEAYGAIPDEYHPAIITYALWKAGDYSDDSSSGMGERYRTLYEGQDGHGGQLAQIRSLVNRRGTAKLPHRKVKLTRALSRRSWVS